MDRQQDKPLAKLLWADPHTGIKREFPLHEGTEATIGRSAANDIHIAEGHVSRQHAVIRCKGGRFAVADLDSVNGTFVKGSRVDKTQPLQIGDEVQLFALVIKLLPADGSAPLPAAPAAVLKIARGPQKGLVFPLAQNEVHIGRATPHSTWEVALQDPTVSRPHALLVKEAQGWQLLDLGSVNGTAVNGKSVSGGRAQPLQDGDEIIFGATMMRFGSAAAPDEQDEANDSTEAST